MEQLNENDKFKLNMFQLSQSYFERFKFARTHSELKSIYDSELNSIENHFTYQHNRKIAQAVLIGVYNTFTSSRGVE